MKLFFRYMLGRFFVNPSSGFSIPWVPNCGPYGWGQHLEVVTRVFCWRLLPFVVTVFRV